MVTFWRFNGTSNFRWVGTGLFQTHCLILIGRFYGKWTLCFSEFGLKRCKGSNLLSLVRFSNKTIRQTFKICIDINTERNSEQDILVIMTNKDDNTKSQHLIPSTSPERTKCLSIKAQRKPQFEILATSQSNVSFRWIDWNWPFTIRFI